MRDAQNASGRAGRRGHVQKQPAGAERTPHDHGVHLYEGRSEEQLRDFVENATLGLHRVGAGGTVTDSLPVSVAFVDVQQRYRFVSAAYEQLFGVPKAELEGKHLSDVLGAEAYHTVKPHAERALSGKTVRYEAEIRYRDGVPRCIEANYIPHLDAAGNVSGFVALDADVTERRNLERFRAAAAMRAEKLAKICGAIASAVSAAEVLEALVDHVADAIDASSVALWLVDDEDGAIRLVRARGYSEVARQAFEEVLVESSPGFPALDCIRRGEPVWLPSQSAMFGRYPHLAVVATPGRAYRIASLPLMANRRVLGALGITIEESRAETAEEREFLLLVSTYAAQAVERLRLLEAERRSREETATGRMRAEQLYRLAQAVVVADRVEVIYEAALDSIQAALGAERAAILTFDDAGTMRFRAWRNLSDEYRSVVQGHSPWPREAQAPAPVLVQDAQRDPAWTTYAPLFQREGIGSLAFFPLVAGGCLLGKFMVYYDRPHDFASSEVETALAIANHVASAIARFLAIARLEETVRCNELFAGVLAHDLRSPLGAMMTAAQLLLMYREGEETSVDRETKPLTRILSSGQRMTTMIEQLLDFTQARSGGGIPIESHPTNLADLLAQAVSEIELAHPEWRIDCDVAGDQRGSWDSDRLLQVFSNLVCNAGQHGTAASPVRVKLDGTCADQLQVEVHNLGAIPESLLPHIFDPFRSTRHRRDQSRGLGLGLFIVREIVRGHGGTIDVCSSEAHGTSFVIQLPRNALNRRLEAGGELASPR